MLEKEAKVVGKFTGGTEEDCEVLEEAPDLIISYRGSYYRERSWLQALVLDAEQLRRIYLRSYKGFSNFAHDGLQLISDSYKQKEGEELEITGNDVEKDLNNLIFRGIETDLKIKYVDIEERSSGVYIGDCDGERVYYSIPVKDFRVEKINTDRPMTEIDRLIVKLNMLDRGSVVNFNNKIYADTDIINSVGNKYKTCIDPRNKVASKDIDEILHIRGVSLKNIENNHLKARYLENVSFLNCKIGMSYVGEIDSYSSYRSDIKIAVARKLSFGSFTESSLNVDIIHGDLWFNTLDTANVTVKNIGDFGVDEGNTYKSNLDLVGNIKGTHVNLCSISMSNIKIKQAREVYIDGKSIRESELRLEDVYNLSFYGDELEDTKIYLKNCKNVIFDTKAYYKNVRVFIDYTPDNKRLIESLYDLEGLTVIYN